MRLTISPAGSVQLVSSLCAHAQRFCWPMGARTVRSCCWCSFACACCICATAKDASAGQRGLRPNQVSAGRAAGAVPERLAICRGADKATAVSGSSSSKQGSAKGARAVRRPAPTQGAGTYLELVLDLVMILFDAVVDNDRLAVLHTRDAALLEHGRLTAASPDALTRLKLTAGARAPPRRWLPLSRPSFPLATLPVPPAPSSVREPDERVERTPGLLAPLSACTRDTSVIEKSPSDLESSQC